MDAQKRYSYKAMIKYLLLFLTFNLGFCSNKPYVVVLGIAQDGGSPHTGCEKNCCKNLWESNLNEKVSCIGIVDPRTKKSWIIDATPDFPEQYRILTIDHETKLEGIFLTHAHMGHYTGLMYLGREVMGAKNIPVFAMPRMQTFLESNGPWNQLISLKNIHIEKLKENKEIKIGDRLFIEPFLVPHRDEYSETVGYRIMGENKSVVYIPDIDKWNKWEQNIFRVVLNTDIALIDGTFYSENELPNRNMNEIPHPFIIETMDILYDLNKSNRDKVYFIHLNHSNPALKINRGISNEIKSKGYHIAQENDMFDL